MDTPRHPKSSQFSRPKIWPTACSGGSSMPSQTHAMMIHFVRQDPAIVLDFCRSRGLDLPPDAEVDTDGGGLAIPKGRDLDADLILKLRRGGDRYLVVVEVQLGRDYEKHHSWAGYLVQAHRRFRWGMALVVITISAAMKAWASRPIPIANIQLVLKPYAMGPEDIPLVTRVDAVIARPELALLSFLMHARGKHTAAAKAVEEALVAGLIALQKRGAPWATEYLDFVDPWMKSSTRKTVTAMWTPDDYIPVGPGKKFYQRGLREGRKDGRAEGKAEGRAVGLTEGRAQAILLVLQGRQVRITAKGRARIVAERDASVLDTWLTRAATATREADVFGNGPAPALPASSPPPATPSRVGKKR